MTKIKVGQEVLYKGNKTCIEQVSKGYAKIVNPSWDYDDEKYFIYNDLDYPIPYWLWVKISELKQV